MPRKWQRHHQDRTGRLTHCLRRNLAVFNKYMRKKSLTDYLLTNQCSRDVKRSSEFCYLGSIVAENGDTSSKVNARIQKTRGSFSKLRRVWLSKSLRKDTKIRIFNACVKSVLLYGCEIWFVTNEIQRKIQTFVNRCLRYILRIWWPNIISNKDLWKVTGQEDIIVEIR